MRLARTIVVSLLVCGTYAAAFGQSGPMAPPPPAIALSGILPADLTISKRVNEVNLAFTVTDNKGHFINDLAEGDFKVLDNRQPPSGITFFQQQTDLPLRVGVLIDASDSVLYRFRFEQRAAGLFLKKIIRPGQDQAFIMSFNSRIRLVHKLSDNVTELARAVKRIRPGGDTALYDAVVNASDLLSDSPPQARRAIILISDGDDTHSHALLYDAEQAAIRAQVTLFALSTNDLSYDSHPKGEAVLSLLSTPSGGTILPAHDEAHLSRAFQEVEKILRNEYALAYQPAAFMPDGSFRAVQVIPTRKGLRVQCRRGYYARREEAQTVVGKGR